MGERAHILVVEDQERLRRRYCLDLELDGYEVTSATDARAALELAHHERPDLILLDLMLPVLDGWELLGELKTDPGLGKVPVVVLAGSAEESDELRARERGALAFLAHPIAAEDVTAVVRRVLAGRGILPSPAG